MKAELSVVASSALTLSAAACLHRIRDLAEPEGNDHVFQTACRFRVLGVETHRQQARSTRPLLSLRTGSVTRVAPAAVVSSYHWTTCATAAFQDPAIGRHRHHDARVRHQAHERRHPRAIVPHALPAGVSIGIAHPQPSDACDPFPVEHVHRAAGDWAAPPTGFAGSRPACSAAPARAGALLEGEMSRVHFSDP